MSDLAPAPRAINDWLDRWIHPTNQNAGPLTRNRARTQVAVCWVGAAGFAFTSIVQVIRPGAVDPLTLGIQMAGMLSAAALLGLLRGSHRLEVTGNLIVLMSFCFIAVPVMTSGSLGNPAIFWTPATSLLAFATVGRTWAALWLLTSTALAGWMFYGGAAGSNSVSMAGHLAGVSALIFAVAAVWDRGRQVEIAELADARDQARAANRAKSAVVAIVSHELRTPMNGVLGMLELLAETGLTEDQRAFTETARSSASGLLSIIEDLLDMSRIEAGQLELRPEPFDVPAVFREIEAMFRLARDQQGVKVELQLAEDVPQGVVGDARRVRQVVTNLVGNALKFTHEGHVRIRVGGSNIDDDTIRLSVWVEDSGIGIPPERLPHVFKPFTQADDSIGDRYGGTGLGLAISNELVHLMGGTIDVRSVEGQGTTFRFDLPLAKSRPPSLEDFGPGLRTVGYSGAVLVAEDQPVNRLVIDRYLARFRVKARFVEDGIAAVQATREQDWDLILMDCEMPVMDGFTATSNLRSAGSHVPVVALTAHATPDIRERCKDAGMDGFLTKPIDRSALRDVLDRWLDPLTEEVVGPTIE